MDGIAGQYDVILSIAAIHYAAAEGRGVVVLKRLADALAPSGLLILIVPRRQPEQPVWHALPRPKGWPVFSVNQLESMFDNAGLVVREICGLYGTWCLLGKQMAMWAGASLFKRMATTPLQRLVRAFPFDLTINPRKPSYALRAVVSVP